MIGGIKHQWSDRKLRVRVTPTGPLEDAYVCAACGTKRQIRSSAPSCPGLIPLGLRALNMHDDDGCYESGRTLESGLHHPSCNAIRNAGPCDVGRGAVSQ